MCLVWPVINCDMTFQVKYSKALSLQERATSFSLSKVWAKCDRTKTNKTPQTEAKQKENNVNVKCSAPYKYNTKW